MTIFTVMASVAYRRVSVSGEGNGNTYRGIFLWHRLNENGFCSLFFIFF